jgi:hypothetical protein
VEEEISAFESSAQRALRDESEHLSFMTQNFASLLLFSLSEMKVQQAYFVFSSFVIEAQMQWEKGTTSNTGNAKILNLCRLKNSHIRQLRVRLITINNAV